MLAPAHLIVLVDGLSALPSTTLAAQLAAEAPAARILAANLRNRSSIADRVVAVQAELGNRAVVNVIAVGEPGVTGAAARVSVADVLAAGAVIDGLVERGIDHISPEAAVNGAAFTGLQRASRHLISASGGGREAAAAGRSDTLAALADTDASSEVFEFLEGEFRPSGTV